MKRQMARRLLAPLVLAVAWQGVAWLNDANESYWTHVRGLASAPISWSFLSSPIEVVGAIPAAMLNGSLLQAGWATFWHAFVATAVAFGLGVSAGNHLAASARLRDLTLPLIRAVSGIPPVTLLPIFLLAFRLSAWSVIALAVFGASFSAATLCMDTYLAVPPDLRTMVEHIGFSPRGAGQWVVNTMMPRLMVAVREAARWSLILVVVGEMHGSLAGGIGAYVDSARLGQRYADVYIGVIACGGISLALIRLFESLGNAFQRNQKRLLLNRPRRSQAGTFTAPYDHELATRTAQTETTQHSL